MINTTTSSNDEMETVCDVLHRNWDAYRWVFEEGADCAKLHDAEGRILFVSRNGQCSLEIDDVAAIRGVPWPDIWPEEMRATVGAALDAARAGRIFRFTGFCPTAKGAPKWWRVLVAPVFDSSGQVEKILTIGSDITQLEQTKEMLREELARMEFLLDAGQIGEWEIDLATSAVGRSQRHDLCFGYAEQVANWSMDVLFQHVHQLDRQRVTEEIGAAIRDQQGFKFECRVVWPDKSVHWLLLQAAPYPQKNTPSRLLGMVLDITERKRRQALAEGQKKALELAVSGAPLSEVLDCLTATAEEATGNVIKTSLLLVSPDGRHLQAGSAPSIPESFSKALDGVEIGPFIGPCAMAAHDRKALLIRDIAMDATWERFRDLALSHGLRSCWSQPILSSRGKLLGTLAAYRDQAWAPTLQESEVLGILLNSIALVLDRHREAEERNAAEQELRELAAQLAEADRRKTEFLATLAHELRNPLAPIRSALEVIAHARCDSATLDRMRETMTRQVTQMSHLVNDLLDVARITSGKLELKKERVVLKAVLATAVDTSRPLIEAAGHVFTFDMPQAPIELEADPVRVAQVVSNLLNNAAKYTPRGGRITLSAAVEDGQAVISVSDTGVGLESEALSSIFEMFSQVRGSSGYSQEGLGIGLTLVKRLVEMHGGTVSACSAGPATGSTFTIRLPVLAASRELLENEALPALMPASNGSGALRILVVDDNADAAMTLASLLEIAGHSVRTVHTGSGALCAREEFQPDIVFLDIGLPDLNGYAVARSMRQRPSGAATTLVALTGWGAHDDRVRSKDAGFDHHLTKPATFPDISRILADHAKAASSAGAS